MKISTNSVVSMHYVVSDSEGTEIDSSFDSEPLQFIQNSGFLISGLEKELIDHVKGDKFTTAVSADEAYGPRHDTLVQEVPRDMFQGIDELHVGMQLRAGTDSGDQTVIIVGLSDDTVTVDGNHPLAGIDLSFEVEITDVREATEEELQHGHVHAAGGCGHSHEQEHNHEGGCCGGEKEDQHSQEAGCCGSEKEDQQPQEGGCCDHKH